MASPIALPEIEIAEGQIFVLKKSTTVIGQAVRVQGQTNTPTRKLPRLGDTLKTTSYSPTESSVQIEIYAEHDPEELALLLGGDTKPVAGGWVGDELLQINPTTAAFDLKLEQYSTASTGSDPLMGVWWFKNFKAGSLSVPVQADGVVTLQINGECDEIYYTPTVGTGATYSVSKAESVAVTATAANATVS